MMEMKEFREWFDEQFLSLLKEKAEHFSHHSSSVDVATITQYILPLASEGKRFRPFLVYHSSHLSKEDARDHFLLFAAIELLHLFALIHDDIMDNAETRHGVRCAHKKFAETYGEKVAEAVAILLGDIVLVWAYDCLFTYTQQYADTRDAITKEFKALVSEVTHGQMLDVLTPVQPILSKELIVQKMTLKTARYSFVRPLRLGLIAGSRLTTDEAFVEVFGTSLGLGFQLQDDLLDGAPKEQTGKTPFLDIEAGQQTILSWYMNTQAPESFRMPFSHLFGKKLTDDDRETMTSLLKESGAVSFIETMAHDYFMQAKEAIATYVSESDRLGWETIITVVQERKK